MSRLPAATDVFTALAEPRRRRILELLAGRRSVTVGAIVLALGAPQSAVSKQLAVLRSSGIVAVSRQGQRRMYSLNYEELRPVYEWIKTFEAHWERQLDRIRARAERQALLGMKQPEPDQKGAL